VCRRVQGIRNDINGSKLHAKIRAVKSNRPDVKGIERPNLAGIVTHTLDHSKFASRVEFDQQLMRTIDQYQPQLIILAGFMRILTDEFVTHYNGRMLNIHPSLLPEFKGLNTHQRALEAKVSQHGVSVHYVSNELDGGPVVLQAVVDVQAGDTAELLQQRIHSLEHVIYPMVIEWIAQHQLELIDQQVYLNKQRLTSPAKWINKQLITELKLCVF